MMSFAQPSTWRAEISLFLVAECSIATATDFALLSLKLSRLILASNCCCIFSSGLNLAAGLACAVF